MVFPYIFKSLFFLSGINDALSQMYGYSISKKIVISQIINLLLIGEMLILLDIAMRI